jgi:hypothetical protein
MSTTDQMPYIRRFVAETGTGEGHLPAERVVQCGQHAADGAAACRDR